jgi:Flp pilus assembly protein TadG
MRTSSTPSRLIRSKRGQTLIELTLIFPLMLALVYGAVEIGSVISTYLTITHTTREGANLTSRGTDPNTALDAIKAAAAPTIRDSNVAQWKITYSRIVQNPAVPCPPTPCNYIIDTAANGRVALGSYSQTTKLGTVGSRVTDAMLPGIDNVAPNQIFHAIEVYYNYTPDVMTYIGKDLINDIFYERTVFTDVSGN